jgi:2-keto-4-pentenoate hydratase
MTVLNDLAEAFLQIQLTRRLQSGISVDLTALSIEDAYEVQRRVIAARVARGEKVVGYKVGCTSDAIRRQLGLNEPICGRLLAPHVYFGSPEANTFLQWSDYVGCAVEPEFVFRIRKDLPGDVQDEAELADAIEWVAPGIEVHNHQFWFGKPSLQELIASNGIHAALVVGADRVDASIQDLALEGVGVFVDGQLRTSGIGCEIMGGPLKSLRWLVHHLARHGEHLAAGQIVIPGSPVGLVSVEPGDVVAARFTRVGSVEVEFAA